MKTAPINAKDIIKRLTKKDIRERISLYLSKDLYADFRYACEKEEVKASQVMEELMKLFVDSLKPKI